MFFKAKIKLNLKMRFYRYLTFLVIFTNLLISTAKIISPGDLEEFNIKTIHKLIKEEKWNCSDVISFFLERAVTYNAKIKAIINFNPKSQEEAKYQDEYYHLNNK